MLVKLSTLSRGERLRINRRRWGFTQAAEARRCRMSLGAYKLAEADGPQARKIRPPALRRLKDYEACLILRRRAGLTLGDLSERIQLSKWWLCLIEQGKAPVATLLNYWAPRA